MRLLTGLSFIYSIVLFISCESTTETESPTPYISLHVGDVRQYFSEVDSSYSKWSIIGETSRTDRQKVFIGVYGEGTMDDTTSNSFYFIRDEYFYGTELDTISNQSIEVINPFNEQRLAKVYPEDGDKWIHTEGEDSIYFVAKYEGDKSTPAKDFNNVYGFTLNSFLTVYYAEGYGHIGSSLTNGDFYGFVNYFKISGKEYGAYVPQDQLPKRTALKVEAIKGKYGIFGERLK